MRYKMSRADRAKQFAPFAALKGYDDMIVATGTDRFTRILLCEEEAQMLSDKLLQLRRGMYVTIMFQTGNGIDELTGMISEVEPALRFVRIDRKMINMDDMIDITGEGIVEPKNF